MKAIGNIHSEPRGATSLSAANYNKMADGVNHWLATDFDRTYFKVRNLAGKRLITLGKVIPPTLPISWKHQVYEGDSMNVGRGRFSRNETTVSWTSGEAGDVGTFSNGTNYIYAELTSASNDPRLVPDDVTIASTTTWPPSGDDLLFKRLLGVLRYDAANSIVQSYDQKVYEDLQDSVVLPDAESQYDAAASGDYKTPGGYKYFSLEWSPRSGRWNRNLQIYGWDSPTTVKLATDDYLMFQDVSDDNKHLRYVTAQGLADYLASIADWANNSGSDDIADYFNNNSKIIHNETDMKPGSIPSDAYANDGHDYRYPQPDTPAHTVDANAGIFSFTNTAAATSGGAGAIKVTGGLYAGDGLVGKATSAAQAGFFNKGSLEVKLCDGTYALDANFNINVHDGDYYHGDNQGQTITNWFGGGILTGGSIVEIDFDDLQSGDKLLVYR